MSSILAFDYDGLIVDTESTSFQAWRELFRCYGSDLQLDTWIAAVGTLSSFDPQQVLEEFVGRPLPTLFEEKYEIHLRLDTGSPLRDGVKSILEFANAYGIKTGIVSNSPRWWIETGLERRQITHLINAIISKEDVQLHKPHPQGYLALLENLDGVAGRSIAFEDSAPGVQAAKAAGFNVVAVPNPITAGSDLSNADAIVESLAVLPLSWLQSRIDIRMA